VLAVEYICVLWVSRGQSILLIGIFVVRNKDGGVSDNIHKYISRYIASFAVREKRGSPLCLVNKWGTQGFDLSVCSFNIA